MGPGGFGGPPPQKDQNRVLPPTSLSDIPRFIKDIFTGFFSRLFYIFELVWKTGKWILISLVFIALMEGLLPIATALISKEILNELQNVISAKLLSDSSGIAAQSVFWGSMVMFLLLFFFILRILSSLITRLNSAITRIAGEKVVRYVKIQIMEKAKTIDLASFDMPDFYESLENANREAGNKPIHVLSSTLHSISLIISLISYIIILATAPGMWWTAIVMLVVSVPSAIINFTYRKKNFMYMRRKSIDRRQMNYYSELMVNKDMVKEIRMFGLADEFIGRYDSVFAKYYSGIRKLIVKENVWHIVTTLVSSIINCVFFAAIATLVFSGRIQIGDYQLYTSSLTSIASTVASLITISATVYEGTLFIDNLISFMDTKPTVVPSVDNPVSPEYGVPHTIEFKNVSFSYPGTSRKVLDNINLTINPGETLVLVGLNGAGKTTFLKLLTRLYDPTEGEILLDGRNIKEYDTAALYKLFGIIFQDFGKYAVTVSENISFGDISSNVDDSRIRDAAAQANAEDYIKALPNAYNTSLMKYFDQNGIELSIGQWQKLSIARAFYSNSDIIILDEPTASLDAIAEQEIFNQFECLRKDKTTIFVSHRLSSATIASKIIVLENGKIVEEGNHKTLMALGGKYHNLFTVQAHRYITSDPQEKNM